MVRKKNTEFRDHSHFDEIAKPLFSSFACGTAASHWLVPKLLEHQYPSRRDKDIATPRARIAKLTYRLSDSDVTTQMKNNRRSHVRWKYGLHTYDHNQCSRTKTCRCKVSLRIVIPRRKTSCVRRHVRGERFEKDSRSICCSCCTLTMVYACSPPGPVSDIVHAGGNNAAKFILARVNDDVTTGVQKN